MSGAKKYFGLVFMALLVLPAACAPVISENIRSQADPSLGFAQVSADPEAHKGEMVIFGGIILEGVNTKEGTLLTILQRPTASNGRPLDVDESAGRFLALYPEFLDVAVYSPGRAVTVAGRVAGRRVQPLGEIEYTYPLIKVEEIYLWPKPQPPVGGFQFYYHPFHAHPFWWTF